MIADFIFFIVVGALGYLAGASRAEAFYVKQINDLGGRP